MSLFIEPKSLPVEFTTYRYPAHTREALSSKHRPHRYSRYSSVDKNSVLCDIADYINDASIQAITMSPPKPQYNSGRISTTNDQGFRRTSQHFDDTSVSLVMFDLELSDTMKHAPDYNRLQKSGFTTTDQIRKFFKKTFKVTNLLITKSRSNMNGTDLSRWHVYIVLDKPVSLADISQAITYKMPPHTWRIGLTSNGTEWKVNTLIDMSIYKGAPKYLVEHSYDSSPVAFLQTGTTEADKFCLTPYLLKTFSPPRYVKSLIHNRQEELRSQAAERRTPEQRAIYEHRESAGSMPYDTVLHMLNGQTVIAGDYVANKTDIKTKNFVNPYDPDSSHDSFYYADRLGGFIDFHHGSDKVITVDEKRDSAIINYTSKYAPLPNRLEHRNQLIISETGSGKTTSASKWKGSIFLVPTQALLRDIKKTIPDANVLRSTLAENGESDSMKTLLPWAFNVMTYHKLGTFIRNGRDLDLLEGYDIIIDEVHKFLRTADPITKVLYRALIQRRLINFQKLCLLSATIDPELVLIDDLHIQRYVSGRRLHVTGTQVLPYNLIKPGNKTLFYQQSILENDVLYEVCKARGLKVITLRGGPEEVRRAVPDDIADYDVIISTSVIEVGVSFTHHIDNVIINTKVTDGSIEDPADIIQIASRVRNNIPDIWVKYPIESFNNQTLHEDDRKKKPNLKGLIATAQWLNSPSAKDYVLIKGAKTQQLMTHTRDYEIDEALIQELEESKRLDPRKSIAEQFNPDLYDDASIMFSELHTLKLFVTRRAQYLSKELEATRDAFNEAGPADFTLDNWVYDITYKEVKEAEALLQGSNASLYKREHMTKKNLVKMVEGIETFKQLDKFKSLNHPSAYYRDMLNNLNGNEPIRLISLGDRKQGLKEYSQVKSVTSKKYRKELHQHEKCTLHGWYETYGKNLETNHVYKVSDLRQITASLGELLYKGKAGWTVPNMLTHLKDYFRFDMLGSELQVVKQRPRCEYVRFTSLQLFTDKDILAVSPVSFEQDRI